MLNMFVCKCAGNEKTLVEENSMREKRGSILRNFKWTNFGFMIDMKWIIPILPLIIQNWIWILMESTCSIDGFCIFKNAPLPNYWL